MDVLFIILGLVLLVFGGDWLLKSAVSISMKLNISRIVIGMTVVSFATSAPELIVSIKSALNGFSDLALGNVIGSNIANLGLVLGVTICLGTMNINKSFYVLDWPMMMLTSLLLYFFIGFDYVLDRYEGFILFLLLVLFLIYVLRLQGKKTTTDDALDIDDESMPIYKTIGLFIIGSVGLWAGSEFLISGAVGLAHQIGISERVIGVTIVSIGTSVPELAASIIAVAKKEKAISLGNLIGSNIFNVLAVLGITAMITPIGVKDLQIITQDIYWMLIVVFMVLPLCFIPTKLKFSFKEGIILLITYGLFMYFTIAS